MAWVKTTDGAAVSGKSDKDAGETGTLTTEQATASAKDRNERAKELGIKTRYEVGE